MLAFKLWLLNLNRLSAIDGTAFGKYMNDTFPVSLNKFDYYKIFDNDPEHHMLYSTKYLNDTSILVLLWKHFQWQSFFRHMHVRKNW